MTDWCPRLVYSWSIQGTFATSIAIPKFTNGLVALICADLMLLLSTDFVRQRFYNAVFIPSHIVLAVIMCVTLCFHYPVCVPYVAVAAGAYGLDRLMRLIKSRVVMARLRPLPDLGMTRVEIPGLNSGWRAGQHVRLRVLSFGMGWRRWAETHPFTIASVSRCPSGEGLVLMVKKAGDWTNKLYDLAQRADYSEANGMGGCVQVIVEGPYGGPGHAIFASFSGAMFVAGGSGITFALAAVQDLMKKDLEYRSRIRAMELVWCIQDPSALTPLLPLFSTLVAQSQEAYASLRISVYYTRAPPNPEVLKTFAHLPPGLTLSPARPKLGKNLKGVVERASALFSGGKERSRGHGNLTGVIVGVCGPSGLGDEVRKAVANFDPDSRKRVGGIELHEECVYSRSVLAGVCAVLTVIFAEPSGGRRSPESDIRIGAAHSKHWRTHHPLTHGSGHSAVSPRGGIPIHPPQLRSTFLFCHSFMCVASWESPFQFSVFSVLGSSLPSPRFLLASCYGRLMRHACYRMRRRPPPPIAPSCAIVTL